MKEYLKREACFACSTPYQAIGAIGIAMKEHLDADLYLFGMFPQYEEVAEKLRKYPVFANVYAVDCSAIGAPGRARGFFQMVFAEKSVRFFLPEDISYETYYSSSRAIMKVLLQRVLLKRNPQMKRVIYEDGMGTYMSRSHPLQATRLKRFSEKLLGWDTDHVSQTRMMVNVPELVEAPAYLGVDHVEQMPRIEFTEENRRMLEDVFSIGEEQRIHSGMILFDTLRRTAEEPYRSVFETLDRCYELSCRYAGENNIICKPHPRSTIQSSASVAKYPYQGIPMEVLYAGMEDLSERILITYTSTAVFSPKILFDREPQVICLHRVPENGPDRETFDEVYLKFRGICSEPDRVHAPESLEELEDILKKLSADRTTDRHGTTAGMTGTEQ